MKKFLYLINILCVAIILFIACSVNEGIYGEWQNVSERKLFSDTINILKLRTKEGSNFPYYTLIYDDNYHASACQSDGNDRIICMSLRLKTKNINPTDEISSVVAAPINDRNYRLTTQFEHHLGYNLLLWKMVFPHYGEHEIVQTFRRDWF